jgi:hypothetical protein
MKAARNPFITGGVYKTARTDASEKYLFLIFISCAIMGAGPKGRRELKSSTISAQDKRVKKHPAHRRDCSAIY